MDIVQPLPGVGEGLRDHFAVRLDWRLRKVRTLNEQTRGLSLAAEALRYVLSGRGVLSWTAGIAHGFVRTLPDLDRPDVQFHFAHASYRNAVRRELDNQPGMTVSAYVMRPESLGSVHCRSRDPLAAPAIRVNVLDTEYDRQTLVRGMKVARRIVANPVFDDIRVTETTPGSDHDDDEALLEHARRNGQTVYHPVGTCRMGRDPLAVVDPRLKVHGVDGLRVVDASVMPTMVSGNVNSAVVMIAERASELVLNP